MVMGMAVGIRDREKRAWVRRSRMRNLDGTGEGMEEGAMSLMSDEEEADFLREQAN